MAEITIRLATTDAADVDALVYQRRRMFEDMGISESTPHGLEKMSVSFRAWAEKHLAAGDYLAWLACDGEQIIGGAGLLLLDWPAAPDGDDSPRGYIYNVYIEPEYRRRGLARQLMQAILDECAARKIKRVRLHASDAGRPLYEKLGFIATNEMGFTFE